MLILLDWLYKKLFHQHSFYYINKNKDFNCSCGLQRCGCCHDLVNNEIIEKEEYET